MEIQERINKLLLADLPKHCGLPESCIAHMAGILTEEPPQNQQDTFDLLVEFISNGGRVKRNEIWDYCGHLNQKLWQDNLVKKENKHSLVAERLESSIIIKELAFFQNSDIVSPHHSLLPLANEQRVPGPI